MVDAGRVVDELNGRLQDVYFEFDSSELAPDALAVLRGDAELLTAAVSRISNLKVTVEGHCDERGSAEYDLALGDRRARRAADGLHEFGERLPAAVVISYGKESPQCTEATRWCRQRNQRGAYRGESGGASKLVWTAMISCRHVTKRYGDFTAVDDFNFDVDTARICALLGPNGAGKSTLLKMLAGLSEPTAGEVLVAGLHPFHDAVELKKIIGMVPENLALFDDLSIVEHLMLCGPIYGVSAEDTEARAEQLLRVLGLDEKRDTFLRESSHGMRKKTALAMALIHNPRVVILDEPFEGIDPVTAETIAVRLRTMSEHGITVLFTSHILSMVDRVADQVIMIRSGKRVLCADRSSLTEPLDKLFFDLVEAPNTEDLPWLRSQRS